MRQVDNIANQLCLALKERGYRKSHISWSKTKERLTVVFSIQKSQYSSDVWYYSLGICLHDIAEGTKCSISKCQIKYRVDNVVNGVFLSPVNVINLLDRWESMYGDLKKLHVYAIEGKLPGQCTLNAVRYLSSVNLATLFGEE